MNKCKCCVALAHDRVFGNMVEGMSTLLNCGYSGRLQRAQCESRGSVGLRINEWRTSHLSLPPLLAISTHEPGHCLPSVGRTCRPGSGQAAFAVVVCVARVRSPAYTLLIFPFVGSLTRLRTAGLPSLLTHPRTYLPAARPIVHL